MKLAVALMAGLHWLRKDKLLLPDRVSIGAYRWQNLEPVYVRLWQEYLRTINFLKTNKVQKVQMKSHLPWTDDKLVNLYYAEIGGRY